MPSAEIAPAPNYETPDRHADQFPHYGIPGFEKLPLEARARYLKIPPAMLDRARPLIEAAIAEYAEGSQDVAEGQSVHHEAETMEALATTRIAQTNSAIETFHRAAQGDPDAKKDLLDMKKELLDEEPSDDDVFQTILETQSGNPFAQDTVLEVMLTDEQAQAHQDVLDLFKEFRGDLASVDDALKPNQQIDLFIELTKGQGSLTERMFFVRKALNVVTVGGQRNLFEGLKELGVLNGRELSEGGVKNLKELTDNNKQSGGVFSISA